MNKGRKKTEHVRRFFKAVFFPIRLLAILFNMMAEKMKFSIRFTLSLRYIKILVGAMIGAGLGVILVFGIATIQEKVAEDHIIIMETLNKDQTAYTEMERYAQERKAAILIYDYDKKLIYTSDASLAEYEYKTSIGMIRTETNFYLTTNRSTMSTGVPVRVMIYSDISGEISIILKITKIILIVFSIILFLAIICIALSGRGIFQPIKEMTQTVKDISEKNLNLRLNVGGSKNELKELALTFNEMMNRIEDHYNRQQQFVSDASHELRTPIAVVQGYAVMLDRWGKNDQEVLQESIEAIKNEAENMKELIDKLLFLARHDKSTFVFQIEEFSLSEMLLEIAKETQIIDSSHRIHFQINKEVSLYADKNRIKQAIRIFIDNAIKYTPADGEITVSLAQENDSIGISIKDTGIGMTKTELGQIFYRFYRSDQSRTREKGGHGLGLAIAKIIILGHNGQIKVKSKLSEGSEFIILLPERNQS